MDFCALRCSFHPEKSWIGLPRAWTSTSLKVQQRPEQKAADIQRRALGVLQKAWRIVPEDRQESLAERLQAVWKNKGARTKNWPSASLDLQKGCFCLMCYISIAMLQRIATLVSYFLSNISRNEGWITTVSVWFMIYEDLEVIWEIVPPLHNSFEQVTCSVLRIWPD